MLLTFTTVFLGDFGVPFLCRSGWTEAPLSLRCTVKPTGSIGVRGRLHELGCAILFVVCGSWLLKVAERGTRLRDLEYSPPRVALSVADVAARFQRLRRLVVRSVFGGSFCLWWFILSLVVRGFLF